MLKLLCLAVVFFAFSGLAPSQDRIVSFAGTWEAKFKGAVFCVLTIKDDAKILGTILAPGSMHLDEKGALIHAEPCPTGQPVPLLNARADGDSLTFPFKDNGERIIFTVDSNRKAALKYLDARMRPITLERKS